MWQSEVRNVVSLVFSASFLISLLTIYLVFITLCVGQPKRHLLTTGWSMFVGAKRLKAGDAVLFIRYHLYKLPSKLHYCTIYIRILHKNFTLNKNRYLSDNIDSVMLERAFGAHLNKIVTWLECNV